MRPRVAAHPATTRRGCGGANAGAPRAAPRARAAAAARADRSARGDSRLRLGFPLAILVRGPVLEDAVEVAVPLRILGTVAAIEVEADVRLAVPVRSHSTAEAD